MLFSLLGTKKGILVSLVLPFVALIFLADALLDFTVTWLLSSVASDGLEPGQVKLIKTGLGQDAVGYTRSLTQDLPQLATVKDTRAAKPSASVPAKPNPARVLSYSSSPQDENAQSLNSGAQKSSEGGGERGKASLWDGDPVTELLEKYFMEMRTSSSPTSSNRVEIPSKKDAGLKKGGKKSGKKKRTSGGERISRAKKDASTKSEDASKNQLDQEKVERLVTKAKAHAQALQAVKKAVFEVQLLLLEGVKTSSQLQRSSDLLTRSEYQDVVVERSIEKKCGYPVCTKPLVPEQRKGRFRLSVSERKIYDSRESGLFCSQSCQATSKTFAVCCLELERDGLIPQEKLAAIIHSVRDPISDVKEDGMNYVVQKSNRDAGSLLSEVKEREDTETAAASFEDAGPSDAIEGYTPVFSIRDWRLLKETRQQQPQATASGGWESVSPDVTKSSVDGSSLGKGKQALDLTGFGQDVPVLKSILKKKTDPGKTVKRSVSWGDQQTKGDRVEKVEAKPKLKAPSKPKRQVKELPLSPKKLVYATNSTSTSTVNRRHKVESTPGLASAKGDIVQGIERLSITGAPTKVSGSTGNKSHLTGDSYGNSGIRLVNETEERASGTISGSSCEDHISSSEFKSDSEKPVIDAETRMAERLASAEDIAAALMEAAEATAAGDLESSEAAAMAGFSILSDNERRENLLEEDMEIEEAVRGGGIWPEVEPEGVDDEEVSSSKGGWHDTAPKNFKLEMSMFGTLWMSLEEWISAATVAFIYGKEAEPEENFLSVNGREYRLKVVCGDSVSAEISRAFSNCVARILPDVIQALGIRVPLSSIEKALSRMVRTMSFVEPLPAFGINQWRMLVMLFLEGLSVDQVEMIGVYLSRHSTLFRKLLDSTGTSEAEYETFRVELRNVVCHFRVQRWQEV
ncbi:hypothetical protein R1flu_009802 [Riccia fluitans]|uniref:RNA polymerase II subunit B1 CTD phosphatase RPAP2 homolog n=1 Tax=Riccia fluitans TaxID=41844 RepID=A0ABD1Z3Y0_9MARC